MNPVRWIDRLVFALLLIATLQIPVLSDQYRQYLAGYIDGLNTQVSQWQALANQFSFASVDGFIRHLESNGDPVVAEDAATKRAVLAELQEKRRGLEILSSENYSHKVVYMFSPENFGTLGQVMENYQPGLPLAPNAIAHSVVLAIILDGLLMLPFWGAKKMYRRRAVRI